MKSYFVTDHYSSTRKGIVPTVLDECVTGADGAPVGIYSREKLASLKKRHADVRVLTEDAYWAEHDKAWTTTPEPITREQFVDALSCMPPENHRRLGPVEVFTFAEKLSGAITRVYVNVNHLYFRFNGRYDLPIQVILDQVGASVHHVETQV